MRSFVNANPMITAPGVDVTGIRWVPGRGWQSGQSRTGTSDAAPIVAGALALVKAKYPDATGNQLIQQLIHNTASGTVRLGPHLRLRAALDVEAMLANDPTGWPDVNPLLKGPRRALEDYPMSSRDAAALGRDPSARQRDPSGRRSSPSAGATTSTTRSRPRRAPTGGGVPVWVVAARRGRPAAAPREPASQRHNRGSRSTTSGRTREEG